MKNLFLLFVLFFTVVVFRAEASNGYEINDNQLDVLFEAATPANFEAILDAPSNMNASISQAGSKSAVVAILLDFFLGGLGIHRFYLGTKTITGIGYILTCGGIFGIVPFVDLVVLAINADDISAYVDNPKFFMW